MEIKNFLFKGWKFLEYNQNCKLLILRPEIFNSKNNGRQLRRQRETKISEKIETMLVFTAETHAKIKLGHNYEVNVCAKRFRQHRNENKYCSENSRKRT